MNRIELGIYNTLKRNPRLKQFVRDVYQTLMDVVPVPSVESAYPIVNREGYFYGFHDHSPFSPSNTRLLACQYNQHIPLRMPLPMDELIVGYFDGDSFENWHSVARTKAWNWHQGCKAFWLGDSETIVFNDRDENRAVARVVSIEGDLRQTISRALGSVSPDGKWGVAYSFNRVERYMPGYGYGHLSVDPELKTRCPRRDGMYLVDMASGKETFLFSISDISARINDEPTIRGSYQFFSHTIFSPCSKQFVFLHRWIHGDVRKRWSRLVISDIEGKHIKILPHREMASHIAWRNPDELLAYCRTIEGKDGYVLFNIAQPEKTRGVGQTAFNSDGHPAFMPNGQTFVTDTYPDRIRRQTINVYDMHDDVRYEIARLRTYRQFASLDPHRHWSCDLHPRTDRHGRYICFDATYTGVRSLCTIDFGTPLPTITGVNSLAENK